MDIQEILNRAAVLRKRQPQAKLEGAAWFRIENAAADEAELYIYDEIGMWGVTANEFAQELRDIKAGVINLHLNSPGGDVFAGIAIFNSLQSHPSQIHGKVDGLAASIASVIAMACDDLQIAKNAQMMIHDPSGFTIGNADDHREMADLLDASSDIIAEVYADKAGGTTAEWRSAMKATTWYRGSEAVEAGLADGVYEPKAKASAHGGRQTRQAAKLEEPEPQEGELFEFDLSLIPPLANGYTAPLPDDLTRLVAANLKESSNG